MNIPQPRTLGRDATIGVLGGGQLGRMLALAAGKLGLKCHVYAPETDSPAFEVVRRSTCADYADENALDRFARDVDVVTYEFENVPAFAATFLAARVPVLPDSKALAITQDRLPEKQFLAELGIPTSRFESVDSLPQLAAAVERIGRPCVLKTRRFGYDGKGQVLIRNGTELAEAWRDVGKQPSVLEAFVPFGREISVVAARGLDGTITCFDVAENEHCDHILKTTRVPAAIPPALAQGARDIAVKIATAFAYVGVFAVEMFVVHEGAGHALVVNEIAPRVHNSGHWTIDGATVSQFEQHIRAIAGWPLALPLRRGRIEMFNLLGDEVDSCAEWLADPLASVHLYGKRGTRPGRKMGHVTRVFTEE